MGQCSSTNIMRAAIIVALAVAVSAEADPYTIGQVNAGLTNGGVITGVDYGHGVVSGLGAVGTGRTVAAVAHAPLTYTAGVASVAAVAHAPVAYTAGVAHAPVAYTAGVAHAPLTYTAGWPPSTTWATLVSTTWATTA